MSPATISSIQQAISPSGIERRHLLHFGAAPLSRPKLFVCGFECSGKTTLTKSLHRGWLESFFTWEGKEADFSSARKCTLGVDVGTLHIDDPSSGLLFRRSVDYSVWDFAGQKDFYPTHELFLADDGGVFLIVCCLGGVDPTTGDVGNPDPVRREEGLLYWLRFIATRFPRPHHQSVGGAEQELPLNRPSVILACSHRDSALRDEAHYDKLNKKWSSAWGEAMVAKYEPIFRQQLKIHSRLFILDCRYAEDDQTLALKQCLVEQHAAFTQTAPPVPRVCKDVITQLPRLKSTFGKIVPLTEFSSALVSVHPGLSKAELAKSAIRFLHYTGEVVWLEKDRAASATVVLDPQWLTKEIIGHILAPNRLHGILEEVAEGKVSRIALERIFGTSWRDPDSVLNLLCALDLCFPLDTDCTLFMFPARLREEIALSALWKPDELRKACCGRRLVCEGECDMFSAGFFPRLQVRIHQEFEAHGVSVLWLWRRSFRLEATNGDTVCIVRISSAARSVDIWVRSLEGKRREAIALCNRILDVMKELQSESCPGAQTEVLILSEQHIAHGGSEQPSGWTLESLQDLQDDANPPALKKNCCPNLSRALDRAGRLLAVSIRTTLNLSLHTNSGEGSFYFSLISLFHTHSHTHTLTHTHTHTHTLSLSLSLYFFISFAFSLSVISA